MKKLYIYDGPVLRFDKWIGNWNASTYAESPSAAIRNLAYRFKMENNLQPNTRITLPGKIKTA